MKVSLNWLVSAEMFLIGQMSPGQVLPGQILLQQLKFVKGSPRNLCLKFGQIGSVTAEILQTLSFCGGVGGVVCKVIFMSNPTFG